MCAEKFSSEPHLLSDAEIGLLADAYLAGEAGAGDRLCGPLLYHATITARGFLGHREVENDDIAQDTVIRVLQWLERRGRFEGSLINFTITVARNRCRNYAIWRRRQPSEILPDFANYLANPALGPLDTLLEQEKVTHLQAVFDGLNPECQQLLTAIYFDNRDLEDLRREAGLGSIQSIYHRRAVCLKKAAELLKNRLFDCSSQGETKDCKAKGNCTEGNHG